MSDSAFSWADYGTLLDAAAEGGWTWAGFEEAPAPGQLLLRHDIDKDTAAAMQMAEYEAERGVRATYLFLLRCPLYSLLEPDSRAHVSRIAELGHAVGLHCDERRLPGADDDFDAAVLQELRVLEAVTGLENLRVVSFHNPTERVIRRAPPPGTYVSTYDPALMPPSIKYLSESCAHWREGDPRPGLRAAQWPRLQLLVHPIYWTRDARRPPLEILRGVKAGREAQLESYLRYSNDLWREDAER